MELKTLKDLTSGRVKDGKIDEWWVDCDLLKQEAIKWVIHGMKKRKNPFKMFLDFFNLANEDLLKDGTN